MSNRLDLEQILSKGESLTVEFKSDQKCLSDRDLVSAIVALANTEGGDLFLGVEDDGTVTGLHPTHRNLNGLTSMIAGKTNPPLCVAVQTHALGQKLLAQISVQKSKQLVSTSEGVLHRRRLMANGKPQAVPFYPHEFQARLSSLGVMDPSVLPVPSLTADDLDPLERQRLRESIRRYGGDASLLPLADDELDGALRLVIPIDGVRRPTQAGLLVLGREQDIRIHLPTHEVAFQVLEGTEVRINEFFRKPLLQTFEEIEGLFKARLNEREIQVGLFRVPIPNFDKRAFREAFVNALVHRDYSSLGAVHVRFDNNGLTISNPGGFVEGVTLRNLLVTEPRPRNPLLADIAKRLGLAERTGRGIDRIYEGLLRFGRSAPDYGRSDNNSVIVFMSDAESDVEFVEMVLTEEERTGKPLPLDSLIILSRLRQERRLTLSDLVEPTQKSENEVRTSIEKLVESGLVESQGTGRSRSYTLSARVYTKSGQKAHYIRQAGFDAIQQAQMVINYVNKHGSIKRADVVELCRLTDSQSYRLLKRLKDEGRLVQNGVKRHAFYTLNS